ncbi:RAD18 ligase, partial [Rhinopomastus cyanomelas]|nr:RAD18 ligase [Rhinopomastus cyanomelas]
VDDLLRCGICFDYFSIAMMIPQCSHNYCSLCIRKFLSYKTQCPVCRVEVSESDLKNNRTLDDLVKSFNSARQQLFQLVPDTPLTSPPLDCSRRSAGKSHAKSPGSWPVVKEEGIDSFLSRENVCNSTKTDGQAGAEEKVFKAEEHHDLHGGSAEGGGKASEGRSPESPEDNGSHEEPSTSLVKVVQKVSCPVCEVAIPEQYINRHLDSCLRRDEKKDSLRSSAHKRKPMPKIVYNLLSDRDLKKKLKELGLSTRGARQQLVRRHQDFVHAYNAQCDALTPKSVAEIVKELEKSEKIRAQLECSKTGGSSLTIKKEQTEEEIDEIHAAYRRKHSKEFQSLVDLVNNRWKKSGKRKAESPQTREDVAVAEAPAAAEPGEERHAAAVLGQAQIATAETPDGRSEPGPLEERQRSASPSRSLSSSST